MKVPPEVMCQKKSMMTMMYGAYDRIVLPVSFLLTRAFHVKLEFLDGFIEGSIVVKTLGLKRILHGKLNSILIGILMIAPSTLACSHPCLPSSW